MTRQLQAQADWVKREDQEWLGRWAREWATDPANKFCNSAKPNEMDRQFLSLFDSIEGCAGDIDDKLETLHETWKHSGLLSKSLYRIKTDYLFRGVVYKVATRADDRSREQMLRNWNRIQNIYNGQDGSYRAAKAWIGPNTGGASVAPSTEEEPVSDFYRFADGSAMEGPLVYVWLYARRLYRRHRALKAAAAKAVAAANERLDKPPDDGVVSDA